MLKAYYPGSKVFGAAMIKESKKWALHDKRASKPSQRKGGLLHTEMTESPMGKPSTKRQPLTLWAETTGVPDR
jgi:hypothetical protein